MSFYNILDLWSGRQNYNYNCRDDSDEEIEEKFDDNYYIREFFQYKKRPTILDYIEDKLASLDSAVEDRFNNLYYKTSYTTNSGEWKKDGETVTEKDNEKNNVNRDSGSGSDIEKNKAKEVVKDVVKEDTNANTEQTKDKDIVCDTDGYLTDAFGNWVPPVLTKVFRICIENEYPDVENYAYTDPECSKTLITTAVNSKDYNAFEFLMINFPIDYEFYDYLLRKCINNCDPESIQVLCAFDKKVDFGYNLRKYLFFKTLIEYTENIRRIYAHNDYDAFEKYSDICEQFDCILEDVRMYS